MGKSEINVKLTELSRRKGVSKKELRDAARLVEAILELYFFRQAQDLHLKTNHTLISSLLRPMLRKGLVNNIRTGGNAYRDLNLTVFVTLQQLPLLVNELQPHISSKNLSDIETCMTKFTFAA